MAVRLPNEFWSPETRVFWIWFPWALATAIVIAVVGLVVKGYFFWGLTPLLLFAMFRFRIVESTDPPKFALMKIWDKVAEGILKPGRYLILPYFPFFQSFEEIDRLYQELTFHFRGIPCRLDEEGSGGEPGSQEFVLGGSFDAEIGLAIEPDPHTFLSFILVGGLKPSRNDNSETLTELHDLIWNNLVQSLQTLGQRNGYQAVVGMPREQVAIFLLNNLSNDISFESLRDIELTSAQLTEEELGRIRQQYLEKVGPNPDISINKWGVNLPQFKVGPIVPPRALVERAREVEEERKIRQRESEETRTFNELINSIIDQSREDGKPTISYAQARIEARIQKGLTPETINRVVIDGLNKPAEAMAGMLRALRGGKDG